MIGDATLGMMAGAAAAAETAVATLLAGAIAGTSATCATHHNQHDLTINKTQMVQTGCDHTHICDVLQAIPSGVNAAACIGSMQK